MNYQDRLLRVIPGGSHTYSRGFDQFPANAPQILKSGKGVEVVDGEGKKYIDYGMGLRAVNIGYAENQINAAAIEQIDAGNNLTRPSFVELEAAELICELIDSIEMVKFAKNGSSSVSAAVKLARAYTGREIILRCADHPFFSYDDWFIGSTVMDKGVPEIHKNLTKTFKYNDIEAVELMINTYPNQIACVILEPVSNMCPLNCGSSSFCQTSKECGAKAQSVNENFLKKLQELCEKNGIVFILDEMITGFRWDLYGAQKLYDVKPDLTTFGKAMANGFSVSCVGGKKEIMQLGSIENSGAERVFLLSSTHGAEMSSLAAFIATVKFMQVNPVIEHNWNYGRKIINEINSISDSLGIQDYFQATGPACSPTYVAKDEHGNVSLEFRTLFMQEMVKAGVLMPWISIAYRHDNYAFSRTIEAVEKSLITYRAAIKSDIHKYLDGPAIRPVFRKYN